ncbi:putative mitochondrial protein [Cucumis melo var. makuwa]|uniref:Mitochondrial protein n=1 Tax=Cucumis melo var. makuwa TaxID=1194695 RepID=A0A5A7SRE7_CUCMM|nr:putative mitochondrial protein [Cucumis melo var. makuwa]TYK17115.1 putative mitochondrial protein [Cucumis melo var. makuwa]
MEENNSFLLSIATLKAELKEARHQFDELSKIVKMLTNGTQRLDDMQSQGKSTLDQVDIVKGKTTENNVSPVKIADRRKKWSCYFCGRFGHIPYAAGKRIKLFHKTMTHHTTSCTLELFHIDLMGSMQTESLVKIDMQCTCFILSDRDQYRKWDSKFNRGMFLGYLTNHKAYRIYNQRTKTVDKSQAPRPTVLKDSSLIEEKSSTQTSNDSVSVPVVNLMPSSHIAKNHPPSAIIGDVRSDITTWKKEQRDYSKMVTNAKAECTPVAAHLKSSKDTAREKVDPSMYCSIIGTVDYGLWYNFDTTVILIGYCDADWVGCSDDHKITS